MRSLEKIFKKITFKNTAIYVVISFLQKAIGFFLLPLYTAVLSPTAYGTVNVVTTIVGLLSAICSLSLNGAASRFYFTYKSDPERIKKIWGSCITFVVANSLVLCCLFGFLHRYLLDPLAGGIDFNPYILLGLIAIGLSPVYIFFQSMLQTEQKGRSYGLNNLAAFLLNIGLTLFFVLVMKWSAAGILAANAITNLVFFIYSGIRIFPHIRVGIDWKILKESLRYSLPLIPYNLAAFTAVTIDRLFLNNMRGTAEVGIYSVGYQFGNIMNVITAAVLQAYSPWFFDHIEKGAPGREAIRRNVGMIVSVFAFLGVGITYASPLLMRFMVNARFSDSWRVVAPLTTGYAFYGVYLLTCNGLFAKKTYYLPLVTVLGALLNIGLNILIIPHLGMFGASLSSLLYNVSISIFTLVLVEKVEHIGYKYSSIMLPFLISMPISSCLFLMTGLSLLPWFSVAAALVAIFRIGNVPPEQGKNNGAF